MRALPLWRLAASVLALAAPARGRDALVSVGACVAESRLAADRPPVVLRVSPWVGGGTQVTLGVRWDDPLGNPESDAVDARPAADVVAYAAPVSAAPSPPRALPGSHENATRISGNGSRFATSFDPARADVAAARAGGDAAVGATVIAIDPGRSLATAERAVETALEVLRRVPRDEEVAVMALVGERAETLEIREKPRLVADFRAPRLGGARHAARRTRAFLRAFAKHAAEEEGRASAFRVRGDDETETVTTAARRANRASSPFDALLRELAGWRADPEGPVARDVVLIAPAAPSAFRVTNETIERDGSEPNPRASGFSSLAGPASPEFSRRVPSVPAGGRWALTLMLADGDASAPPRILALPAESSVEKSERRRQTTASFAASFGERALVIATGWGAPAAASRAALVRARRRNIARVGVCDGGKAGTVSFRASFDKGASFARCSVEAPARPERDVALDAFSRKNVFSCDAAAAAADAYPYPDAIAIRMSASQRVRFDAKRSFFRGSHRASLEAKTDTRARVQFAYPPNAAVREGSAREGDFSDNAERRDVGFFDGATSPPLPAKVRFRGVSSLRDCARRKSMKVNLKGRGRFRLAPGSAGDEFLLISMCYDDRYVKSKLVFSLAKRLGAFPHAARYVRVLIENPLVASNETAPVLENEGLYLLVDDPASSLERRFLRLRTVVRRRNDAKRLTEPGKGTPEVKRPKGKNAESASRRHYDRLALVAATCATSETAADADADAKLGGPPCYEALDERLDLEQYFRWTALMTLVGSGDHVDETWFYASNENASSFSSSELPKTRRVSRRGADPVDGTVPTDDSYANDPERFRVHAWDPDDAFQPCHHGGKNALRDEYGLLICAEGDIDKVFTRDPRTYAAYVDALEWTLRRALTASAVKETAEKEVFRELQSALVDDATAAGLAELVAANPDARTRRGALADIEASLSFYAWTLRERRRTLLRRVARYRHDAAAEIDAHGSTSFAPARTPARSALARESAKRPFEVDPLQVSHASRSSRTAFFDRWLEGGNGDRDDASGKKKKSEIRSVRSIRLSVGSVREYRYDANGSGFQELVARGVAFENDSRRRDGMGETEGATDATDATDATALGSSERLDPLPTVRVPVHADVTYGNVTYRAPPSETRVACFESRVSRLKNPSEADESTREDASAAERFLAPFPLGRAPNGFAFGDDDAFFAALATDAARFARCALRGARVVDSGTGEALESFDAFAFAAAGNGFVSFRFARTARASTPRGNVETAAKVEPIRLAPGQRFETRSALSVFHRDWLPFPRGVLRAETRGREDRY